MGGSSSRSGRTRIDEQLIRTLLDKCLGMVHELDESMFCLFKVLDQLTATLRLITDYQPEKATYDKETPSEAEKHNGPYKRRLTKDLLVRIEEPYFDEKSKSLRKLLQLLRFINTTAKEHSTLHVVDLQLERYKDEPYFKTSLINDFRQTQENEIKELKENQKALKQLLDISRRKEKYFSKEKKEILSENETLNDLNEQKDKEKETLQSSVSSLESGIEKMKSEYSEELEACRKLLVKRTAEKDELIESLERNVIELSMHIDSLTKTVETERRTTEDLRKEYEKVKEELENVVCKKDLRVQLFYQRRGDLISEVVENLKEELKMRMEEGKTELKFVSCTNSSDINPDLPTLLIAICASRLGTDAANAIQGLDLHKKIVLLIFHQKDVHALPSQASERVLTGQEFKRLAGIYDMAFLSNKGIYPCDLNEKSITTVISFLNSI